MVKHAFEIKVIPVGVRKIARISAKNAKDERYVIYLPSELNYLWRELNERGTKVRVLLEIVEEPREEKP